jgi:tetratricopeptide (TPR) repeat protein
MTTNAAPQATPRSRARARVRAGRAPRQLWQVPTFFAGLVALVLVAANTTLCPGRPTPLARDLAAARANLQDPRGNARTAQGLAEKALACAGDSAEDQATAHFLLAVAVARLADQGPAEQADALRKEALAHGEQAESLGVAEADQPRLWFTLGRVLLQTGGDPARAADYLSRGLPQGTDDAAAGYGLLVQACLRRPSPDLEGALQASQNQLEHTAADKSQATARLTNGEILMRLERWADALKTLERVGETAPTEVRQCSLSLQAQCCEKAGLWGKAAPLWQKLLETPSLVPGGKAHVLYTLGQCHLQADPPDPEAARQAWQLALAEGGEEGQAAAFSLAELDLGGLAPDLTQVLAALQRAVLKVDGPQDYQNRLVDLEKARGLFERALRAAVDTQSFQRGQELADLYQRLAAPAAAEERFAGLTEAWARQLEAAARRADGTDKVRLHENAQARWRQAGQAVERAAAVSSDPASMLWRAMQMYRRGQDNDKTAAVLDRLVRLPLPPERQAEAWLALAEARTALDRPGEAHEALVACTNFSDSPFSYRARYLLALEAEAKGHREEAVKILKQSLELMRPERDRDTHEQSQYKLALLLFQGQRYDEAAVRLHDALKSYPANADALVARDHLGECYCKLAEQELKRLREVADPANPEALNRTAAQAHHESQRQLALDQAADAYLKVRDELKTRAAVKPLPPTEDALLRKSALALADIEWDRHNFADALRLYMELARAYPLQRECLDGCAGIGKCLTVLRKSSPDMVRELGRMVLPEIQGIIREVQGNLEQARIPDSELPPDATRRGVQDWLSQFSAYLDRMSRELTPAS